MRNKQEVTLAIGPTKPRVKLGAGDLPNCMVIQRNAFAQIGKIPGEIKEVPLTKKVTILALFGVIGIPNLDHCEIQRNGRTASPEDLVEAGDTILAIAKIRGN